MNVKVGDGIKCAKTKYLEEIKLLDKELRELEALLKEGRS